MSHHKKKLTFILSALAFIAISLSVYFTQHSTLNEREKFSQFLKEHPFNNRKVTAELLKENRPDRPDLAWEQDYMRTLNPTLGRPTPEVLPEIMQQMKNSRSTAYGLPGNSTTPWVERGPNNVGGRTRALVWDPNDATGKKVWAGGVTGGLWYNDDITNTNSSWIAVNDFWDNIAITCIAFDPNNTQIIYVGTGEGFGAGASRGAGIWKSTNGGNTWSQISSTTSFYYINDLVVRNESGTSAIYAAVDGGNYGGQWHGSTQAGIQRSTNGGSGWTNVSPNVPSQSNKVVAADLELGSNNRIWVGSKSNPYGFGGGRILYTDNGTTFTTADVTNVSSSRGRVELACSPSNTDVVYAIIEDNGTASVMKKTTSGGSSWSTINKPVDADTGIPNTDFTRGQAWYDLIMAVDPNNENVVLVGGIDLFRTANGGTSWSQISKWSNNNNLANLSCSRVHADHHAIVYKPGSSSTVILGNDGGVFYTTSIATAANNDVIAVRNKNYNVTQFYACAIHPTANSNVYLAGAQDNGTQRYSTSGVNATTEVYGGDGAYCFIDQNNPNYQIASYVHNTFYRSTNGGTSYFTDQLVADQATGRFINPADYDDNMNILYSCRNASSLMRIKNITTSPTSAQTVNISGMSDFASHIRVSPHTTSSSTLFVGTEAGDLYKVTNADNTPTTTNITGSTFPAGSISCVEIGANENELLVTFFNYGVSSVWYTSNGGTSWVSKEGNLPDMPVRWALFNPLNRNEVILATELGIWGTTNLSSNNPTWISSNSGLANVRVDMLQIRDSDKQVIAATHGRGLFSCNAFASGPTPGFTVSNRLPCVNQTITLTDTTLGTPTSWNWSISPATFTFMGSTNATSQNPEIQFTAAGNYSVTLTAGNSFGNNSVTRTNIITVGGLPLPFTENWENTSTYQNWLVENTDNNITWNIYNISGNSPGNKSAGIDNWNYTSAGSSVIRDGLISPPIRLVGYQSANLSFQHAYRRYSSVSQDSLAIYISLNCGSTWTRIGSYSETQSSQPYNFITNSNYTSAAFSPTTSADWCGNSGYANCKSINLNAYVGNVIQVKFENISGYGNNLFIDNISVTGTPNKPVADFSASTTAICQSASISFSDSSTNNPTSWSWAFTPTTVTYMGGTNSNSQNPIVSFQNSGTYTVQLTATNQGGNDTKIKTSLINVSASVNPSITISASNTNVCEGTTINFTSSINNGGNNPSYAWKVKGIIKGTGTTYSDALFSNGDTVICTLTSNATCASPNDVNSNSIVLTINNNPNVNLSLTKDQACVNDTTFNLSGGTPLGGSYSGQGVSSNSFNPSSVGTGQYTIKYRYTNGFGCSDSVTDIMNVNALPQVPSITQNNNTLACSVSGMSYKWFKENIEIPGSTSQSIVITASGNYSVEITNASNCKSTSNSIFAAYTSSIAEEFFENFTLYPNPAKDYFNIRFNTPETKTIVIEIYDMTGKVIWRDKNRYKQGEVIKVIDTKEFASGVYLLRISDGRASIQKSLRLN